ncbi:unnamed protein product [Medioppia subpectinata]|uniref:Piwi domain-containing protein n=1 Tax=Medioppia subpectinata TaxID=1979941 RepID=A0A7R9KEN8_9ACAR|nr:unnamed protein product [Medioppia subpectinata]CAG2101955.1 unnamed protein product [Medioppia subpectinata]
MMYAFTNQTCDRVVSSQSHDKYWSQTLYLKTRVIHPFIGLESRGGRGGGGGRGYSGGGGGGQRGRGGRGGGGDGPQRQNVPDVRALAQRVSQLAIGGSGTTPREPTPRGTLGAEIELIVNLYPITGWEQISLNLYDIDIRLPRNDGHGFVQMTAGPAGGQNARRVRDERKADNIRVVQRMDTEWREAFGGLLYAFDGQRFLYVSQQLPTVAAAPITRTVTIQLDGFPEQTFEVRIQYVRAVSMAPLVEYFSGHNPAANAEDFRESIQALEIVMRYMPAQTLVLVFRNLFSRDGRRQVAANVEIAAGHSQAIYVTESGVTANFDRAFTLMVTGGPLTAFIERELNIRDIRNHRFTAEDIRRVSARINGLTMYTNHILNNGVPQRRNITMNSMVAARVHEHTFTDGNGQSVTVEAYFRDTYPHTGQLLRNVGLIKARNGNYFPVDVCHVPDQPMPRRMVTPEMTQQIVRSANSQDPSTRFGLIQQSAEEVEAVSRALMASFGLELNLVPIKLTGRVLPAPRLLGNQRGLESGRPLNRWAFFNYSQAVDDNYQEYYDNFFPELIRNARENGITIVDHPVVNESHRLTRETIEADIAQYKDLDMIFICLPVTPIYKAVKRYGDRVYGVATQCILDQNLMRTPRGYFRNYVYKTKARTGGQNQVLAPECRPSALLGGSSGQQRSTMVVGVDVIHSGVGQNQCPSIAASVASIDREFSVYHETVAGQPPNTELIPTYDQMFVKHLKAYQAKNNNSLPQSVILYRDGVSDGQLDQVLAVEIPLIRKAYDSIQKGFQFKLTAFVVQKRHHIRFMPFARTNDARGREIRNIPAGTVVDHTITHPLRDEFHLCSHNGLLGTSRHAKYVCLRDDHNLTADQKQLMSYNLCHTYCRCATPISIPVPVAYADLLATRAKVIVEDQNLPFQPRVRDETPDQRRAREAANVALLNANVEAHRNVIYLPFYA